MQYQSLRAKQMARPKKREFAVEVSVKELLTQRAEQTIATRVYRMIVSRGKAWTESNTQCKNRSKEAVAVKCQETGA